MGVVTGKKLDIEGFIKVDVDSKLLDRVIKLLRDSDPFVAPPSNIDDVYDITQYIRSSALTGVELHILVDNNVLTRAISIAKGEMILGSPESQRVKTKKRLQQWHSSIGRKRLLCLSTP